MAGGRDGGAAAGVRSAAELHVTGCPNGCGQHWIADVGIEGKKIKHNGAMVDAYYFCVGGSVGATSAIATPGGVSLPGNAGAGVRWNDCCADIWRAAGRVRVCGHFSAGTATTICVRCWREK